MDVYHYGEIGAGLGLAWRPYVQAEAILTRRTTKSIVDSKKSVRAVRAVRAVGFAEPHSAD
jgi:hypothetical protein